MDIQKLNNINQYDIPHKKLHNVLYIHLCRVPYAVKYQSYALDDGQKIARNMLS